MPQDMLKLRRSQPKLPIPKARRAELHAGHEAGSFWRCRFVFWRWGSASSRGLHASLCICHCSAGSTAERGDCLRLASVYTSSGVLSRELQFGVLSRVGCRRFNPVKHAAKGTGVSGRGLNLKRFALTEVLVSTKLIVTSLVSACCCGGG